MGLIDSFFNSMKSDLTQKDHDRDSYKNYIYGSAEVVGLMCLPPVKFESENYFKLLKNSAEKINLKDLSMGMSSDFEDAVLNNSTYYNTFLFL